MRRNPPGTLSEPRLIPSLDYGGDGPTLHFAHANGFPPGAYRPLLDELAIPYHVVAMHQRPLWRRAQPAELHNWRPLAEDLENFFVQENLKSVYGVGHSLGATTTLHLAIQKPQRFTALVLLDPVIFPAWMTLLWQIVTKIGLGMKVHPLAANTLRRRRSFESPQAMFAHYRSKPVFAGFNDDSLHAYVQAASRPAASGGIELVYSPEWETRIYLTASLADLDLWRGFNHYKLPTLILRGQESDTFAEKTARRIQKLAPQVEVLTLPESGHLFPLEKPHTVANIIKDFLGTIPG